jgi:hypothetical protein
MNYYPLMKPSRRQIYIFSSLTFVYLGIPRKCVLPHLCCAKVRQFNVNVNPKGVVVAAKVFHLLQAKMRLG